MQNHVFLMNRQLFFQNIQHFDDIAKTIRLKKYRGKVGFSPQLGFALNNKGNNEPMEVIPDMLFFLVELARRAHYIVSSFCATRIKMSVPHNIGNLSWNALLTLRYLHFIHLIIYLFETRVLIQLHTLDMFSNLILSFLSIIDASTSLL
ncbi:hypothetical protein ACJX0J_010416, partial [Zea mays]